MSEKLASTALIVSVISNLAVLAGVVFVVVQVHQANQSLEIDHQWAEKAAFAEWMGRVSESPELAAAIAKVEDGSARISEGERMQLRYWIGELQQIAFAQANLYEAGVLTRAELNRRLIHFCDRIAAPMLQAHVERIRSLNPDGKLWGYIDEAC